MMVARLTRAVWVGKQRINNEGEDHDVQSIDRGSIAGSRPSCLI
jgi:hypothetical protein